MPVMALYRSREITRQSFQPYDEFVTSRPVPPGALLHLVAFDDEGICVVDVWESRGALDAFTENTINPTLKRFGLPIVIPTVLDVTSVATHNGIDLYKTLNATLATASRP